MEKYKFPMRAFFLSSVVPDKGGGVSQESWKETVIGKKNGAYQPLSSFSSQNVKALTAIGFPFPMQRYVSTWVFFYDRHVEWKNENEYSY
jgi:hypothetical protein